MQKLKKRRVLIYYPPNSRSVAIETIAFGLKQAGCDVIALTTSERGAFHTALERRGIPSYTKTFKNSFSPLYYLRHFFFLVSFCRKHKVDALWSHLQTCNIVAVFAQFFIRARVVIFRHHFHAVIKERGMKAVNGNERLFEKIICRLAKEIVVPSLEVYNGMIRYEEVPAGKIFVIPYVYDFSEYPLPDPSVVASIKEQHRAKLLVIVASRMIAMKRHMMVLPVFAALIRKGLDIKVMLMDEGPEKQALQEYVSGQGLNDRIFFPGYKTNIIDYLSAADLLVHPSATEASSSLVKEVALQEKAVIVCSGVGDFDQYIEHGKNGFLVNPGNEDKQFTDYISYIYDHPEEAAAMGKALHRQVMSMFTLSPATMDIYLQKI